MSLNIIPSLQPLTVAIADLHEDPANARKGHAIDRIAASLKQYGQRKPIVVNRLQGNKVEAGNGTLAAAKSLGWTEIAAVFVDDDAATAAAYGIADNRVGEFSQWDAEILADLMPTLDGLVTGFTKDELKAILPVVRTEGDTEPQIDKAEELRVKWGVESGQMWQLGDHRIICGDCTDAAVVARVMDGERAGMVFTDPPYGVEWQNNAVKRFDKLENDDRILEIAPIVFGLMADDTAAFIWTAQSVYPQWREQFNDCYKSTIIWNKGGGGKGDLEGDFMPVYEMALFCVKGKPTFQGKREANVWNVTKDAMGDYEHPTQKPVELARIAIESMCRRDGSVVDLFLGSGTTLIACENLGRKCRAIEISPGYVAVAIERWAQHTGREPELL